MTDLDKQMEALIAERNQFEAENIALKAQVSLIKSTHSDASGDIATLFKYQQSSFETGEYRVDGQSCTELDKAINQTPEQCLNSIKADAIDEFWVSMLLECLGSDNGFDAVLDCYTNDNLLTPVKEYYVGKLRGD